MACLSIVHKIAIAAPRKDYRASSIPIMSGPPRGGLGPRDEMRAAVGAEFPGHRRSRSRAQIQWRAPSCIDKTTTGVTGRHRVMYGIANNMRLIMCPNIVRTASALVSCPARGADQCPIDAAPPDGCCRPGCSVCRHQHRRHHAGGRADARRLLCAFRLEGRSVRGNDPDRPRAARPAAGRRAACRAEGLSRQGQSRCHRAGLHPRRPARRRRPRDPRRPAGLCQRPLRDDRRAGARQAASSMPTPRWRRSSRSAPSSWRAPRATRGSATGCCAARGGPPCRLLKPRASPAKKRSKSRRKAAGARRAKRAARSRGGRAAAGPKARSSAARR